MKRIMPSVLRAKTLIYNITGWFEQSKLIIEENFTERTNITTKLKQKLFTKVIKMPGKTAPDFG